MSITLMIYDLDSYFFPFVLSVTLLLPPFFSVLLQTHCHKDVISAANCVLTPIVISKG